MQVRLKKNGVILAEANIDRISKFQTSKESKMKKKVIESKVIKNGKVVAESTNENYKQVKNNFKSKNDYRNNNNKQQERKENPTAQQKAREVEKEKNDIKKAINKNINSQNKKGQRTSRSVGFANKYGTSTTVTEQPKETVKDVTNRPVEEVLEEVKNMVEDTVSIGVTTNTDGTEKVILKGVTSEETSYEDMEIEGEFETSNDHIKNNF